MANHLYDTLFAPHDSSDAPFFYCPGQSTLTYRGFLARAAQFAAAFVDMGLLPGDRVAAQIDKSTDAVAVYVACVRAGLIFLPLNVGYTPTEVSYFLNDSGAKVFLCPDTAQAALSAVAAATDAQLVTLNRDGTGEFADRARTMESVPPVANRGPDDLAAFLYTSGTTGRSKGAMLSHKNLLSNAVLLAKEWHFEPRDVLLHALPIFHTHGLFVAINTAATVGSALIFHEKFDSDALIGDMPQATVMMGVPTFYSRLLDNPDFTSDVSRNMRLFISGSAPMLPETHRQFAKRTGHRILERYGMTETNMSTSNPYNGERKIGTVGPALPGVELKITDPKTGAALPLGDIGVIEVRGDNVFQGYWQMPEKTAAELRADGFFITGDLGHMDADGYVTIVGRDKDLIISGGYNVYPKEVESLIDAQPDVLESAVIGVPDSDLGEVPLALIVAREGITLDLAGLAEAIGSGLARFKQPRQFLQIPALPRNAMGKVQKNVLRDNYARLAETVS